MTFRSEKKKEKPPTAKQRTAPLFIDAPQVVPSYIEPLPKHFTQRVAQVARDLPGSRTILDGVVRHEQRINGERP